MDESKLSVATGKCSKRNYLWLYGFGVFVRSLTSNPIQYILQALSPVVWPHVHVDAVCFAVQPLPNLHSLLCFQHHITLPLLRLILTFYGRRLSALPSLTFIFSLPLPLSTFPSQGPFFSRCGMLDYSSVLAIISLSDEVMWGLLSPSFHLREMWQIDFTASSYVCI